MFSFGIFVSHTPFLIMAGLYLFYMLVNFGMKFNQEAVDDASSDEKVISHITHATGADDETLLSLSAEDFQKKSTDDAIREAAVTDPPATGLILKRYLFRNRCIQSFPIYCLFSRPPPLQA